MPIKIIKAKNLLYTPQRHSYKRVYWSATFVAQRLRLLKSVIFRLLQAVVSHDLCFWGMGCKAIIIFTDKGKTVNLSTKVWIYQKKCVPSTKSLSLVALMLEMALATPFCCVMAKYAVIYRRHCRGLEWGHPTHPPSYALTRGVSCSLTFRPRLHYTVFIRKWHGNVFVWKRRNVNGPLMQFCIASMSAIMKLTKHGAIIPTHTPCLVIANMADMEALRNCITTYKHCPIFLCSSLYLMPDRKTAQCRQ